MGIKFEGTISGVGAGVPVVIERTEVWTEAGTTRSYTQQWIGWIKGGNGHFETDRTCFNPVKTTTSATSGDYQMYINGKFAGERNDLGVRYGSPVYDWPIEIKDPSGFRYFWEPQKCYHLYSWTNEEIPEFSTIAIPIASILGLLFFFNHRKHRKE